MGETIRPDLVVCTGLLESDRAAAAGAAALAVAAALERRAIGQRAVAESLAPVLVDLRDRPGTVRASVLAAPAARAAERAVDGLDGLRGAARGRICVAAPAELDRDGRVAAAGAGGGKQCEQRVSLLADLLHGEIGLSLVVVLCDPRDFRPCLELGLPTATGALLHAGPGCRRELLSLLCFELAAERIPVKVWSRPIGVVAARRSLAGLEAGGPCGERAHRFAMALCRPSQTLVPRRPVRSPRAGDLGQALPALLGIAFIVIVMALALVAIGGATTAKGRFQRAADLAAISAARSMHDDFARLFAPSHLPDGTPNPVHLSKAEYLDRAKAAAAIAIERNGSAEAGRAVSFPDAASFAPLRVRVRLSGEIALAGAGTGRRTGAAAEAKIAPVASAGGGGVGPAVASGGGYAGPLQYRQGKPMRPDVAIAFDRMAAAARRDGHALLVNSGFRSDAEQQALWNANPDPRWVARPGTSLHRCGTELDLGPATAYGWLAGNAARFGFQKRYAWEPWHFGFTRGPEPCSAAGERVGAKGRGDGRGGGARGLPDFVPSRFRAPLLAAASRHDVSAALLAAQLMAESNFNPAAVSSAGAQGIAQFMPATAAAYGLDDPFDPIASIHAQARMMSELLRRFGSVGLALAAYNAGPGAVSACACIPPYPETQAYVTKILGLLRGAGELAVGPPVLEVRLVD